MRGSGALILLALSGIVTPADGSALAEPPAQVSVVLPSAGVREAHLSVASGKGVSVTTGPAVINDGVMTVPVRIVEDGTYLVAFHLVHLDGRVEAGVTRFGVGGPPAASPAAHAHPAGPWDIALTLVAAALVLVSLYLLLSRPRPAGRTSPVS